MATPHSDACYVRAYPAATAEAWVDGHVHAKVASQPLNPVGGGVGRAIRAMVSTRKHAASSRAACAAGVGKS